MTTLTALERCFGWLLQTTWQAAVIAVIILFAQFLLRNRLSPAWRHGLWFLLVARLLMPMTPGSAVSIFNLAKWPQRQVMLATVAAPAAGKLNPPAPAAFSRQEEAEVQPAAAPPTPGEPISEPIVVCPPPPACPLPWPGRPPHR